MKPEPNYLSDLSSPPMLSASAERALIQQVRENEDRSAREILFASNLQLVLAVLKRFTAREEPLSRLFQVGCIGLTKAIDQFDLERNFYFTHYAAARINDEIQKYLKEGVTT
jgi:RNA polymerase sporulation-specific sigma factor